MTDWTAVTLRFATYADLALLAGVPFQLWRERGAAGRLSPRAGKGLALLGVLGLVISGLGLLALTASMAGTGLLAVDRETLRMVLSETPPGSAFLVRFAALGVALFAALSSGGGRGRLAVIAAAGGAALATVAWTGHGAMDEGGRGWVHLAADILHLLAAAYWTGAIATLLASLRRPTDPVRLRQAARALAGFAGTGSVLVAVLIVTGAINGWMLLGIAGLPTLPATLYGRLLIAKLALFGVLLAIAAANRWRLTPRLDAALVGGDLPAAVRALRRSIGIELATVLLVLAIVAWLGMMSPLPDVA